jgi:hypothetical protein
MCENKNIPPGYRATAAFFRTASPVNRATDAGTASNDVEKIIGITPELLTCISNQVNFVLDCTQRERKKESLTFPPTH